MIICLVISCQTNKSVANQPTNKILADQIAHNTVVVSHTGNGTSIADAVIIQEKKGEQAIAVEEKAWLNEKYPGYTWVSTRIINENQSQKIYDVYKIKTTDGVEFEVFFDVSIFYNSQTN